MNEYEVIVGNLGLAYRGPSYIECNRTYGEYKRQSKAGYGRVANESVIALRDGEVMHEYQPKEPKVNRCKQVTEKEGRRVLSFDPAPAVVSKSKGDPNYFTFEWAGEEKLGLSAKSDDPVFWDKIEDFMRGKGIAIHYPTPADHVWLAPEQYELAKVPDDWQVFHDDEANADIHRNRFYGFGDAGGLAGSFEGYETREAAIAAIGEEYREVSEIGIKPEQLGEFAITVLSGEEFVNRLQVLDAEGAAFYGRFVG